MRSICSILFCFFVLCTSALANCNSENSDCETGCLTTSFGGAIIAGRYGGSYDPNAVGTCFDQCKATRSACEAVEQQQERAAERARLQQQKVAEQQQKAAERKAQQARDDKELVDKQQIVQRANKIAQKIITEAAIAQQFDAALEKGRQALDQKNYLSAELQFKAVLKIKPTDREAKTGLLRAFWGAGQREVAYAYANEQLLASASKSTGTDGHSAYARWIEVLGDNGLTNDAERSQLKLIYPFGDGDPERAERAATTFLNLTPKVHLSHLSNI